MKTIGTTHWGFSLLTSQILLLGIACSMLPTSASAANRDIAPPTPVNMSEAAPPWANLPSAGAETAAPVEAAPAVAAAPATVGSGSSVESWYRNRRPSTGNPGDSLSALQSAAQAGDASAQYRLAMQLRGSDNPNADIKQSLNWQQRAAVGGNAEAQYGLGVLYANGQYVPADNNLARNWFQKAAQQGHVAAKLALVSLNNGSSALAVAASTQLRNDAEPVRLATQPAVPVAPSPPAAGTTQKLAALQLEESPSAAALAEPSAPPMLMPKTAPLVDPASRPEPALMNASLQTPADNGSGASASMDLTGIEPAVVKQSAEAGDKQAQLMLGTMYEDGVGGLPSDLREAAYWYEQAARQGYPKAQYNLGLLYEDGRGVKQDHKQAAYWYDKAARAGFGEAQNNLGVLFVLGKGVNKNPKRAEQLFTEAARSGNADARRNLDMLRKS